jgi:hypothetical protein
VTRIEKLYAHGYNEWDMAFLTGLLMTLIHVVKEYVEIIKSYKNKKITKLILKINS